jgi:hypothetical protein
MGHTGQYTSAKTVIIGNNTLLSAADYMTAYQYGIYVEAYSGDVGMNVISWKEGWYGLVNIARSEEAPRQTRQALPDQEQGTS